MSFTTKVKEELIHLSTGDNNELAAIIKLSGSLGLAHQSLHLSITTENAKIARYIYSLIEDAYVIVPEIRYHQKTNLRKNRVYTVYVEQGVETILADLKLADSFLVWKQASNLRFYQTIMLAVLILKGLF